MPGYAHLNLAAAGTNVNYIMCVFKIYEKRPFLDAGFPPDRHTRADSSLWFQYSTMADTHVGKTSGKLSRPVIKIKPVCKQNKAAMQY